MNELLQTPSLLSYAFAVVALLSAACSGGSQPTAMPAPTQLSAQANVTPVSPTLTSVIPLSTPANSATPAVIATSRISAYRALPHGEYIIYGSSIVRGQQTIPILDAVSIDGALTTQLFEGRGWGPLSPDATRIALIDRPLDKSSVAILDLIQGKVVDFPNSNHCYDIAWSPDGANLIVLCNDYYIYQLSVSGGTATLVFSDPDKRPTISRFSNIRWSPNGKWLAYYRWKANGPDDLTEVYVLDLSCLSNVVTCQNRSRRLTTLPGYKPLTWTPDNYLALINSRAHNGAEIELFDVQLGADVPKRTILIDPSAGGITSLAWSPDGTQVAITQADKPGISLIPISGGQTVHIDAAADPIRYWLVVP